jgi:hypothetical protein
MRISNKNAREPEKKIYGLDDNPTSMVELRKGIKEFCVGLISHLDVKINKLNEGLAE